MYNPARDLLLLFEKLNDEAGQTQESARGWGAASTEQKAAEMQHSADLLSGVLDSIRRLRVLGRSVDVYERMIPAWTYGVFAYPIGWQPNPIGETYNQHRRDVLALLAETIDSLQASPDAQDQLRDLVRDAEHLLIDDESITDQMRFYLSQLLQEIRHVLSDEEMSRNFDLNQALQHLWVAFYGAAAQSSDAGRWKKLADKLVYPTISGVLVNLPSVAVSVLALTNSAS